MQVGISQIFGQSLESSDLEEPPDFQSDTGFSHREICMGPREL